LAAMAGEHGEIRLTGLAHHFFEAGSAGDPQRAIAYARQAADQALALYAYDAAARHLEHAGRLLAESRLPGWEASLCEINLAQAEALDRAGDGARARATFAQAADRARNLSLPEHLARAALGLATRWTYDDPTVLPILDEAAQGVGDADPRLRARLLGRLAQALYFMPDSAERRVHLCDEAAALARRVGDPALLGEVLADRLEALFHDSNIEDQCATATTLMQVAPTTGDPRIDLTARAWWIVLSMRRGLLREADSELVRFAQLADDLRQPRFRWYALYFSAALALARGRVSEAERLALEALQVGGPVSSDGTTMVAWAQLFAVRREQGQLHSLAELGTTAQVSALPASQSGRIFSGLGLWLLPLFLSEQGRFTEARAAFDSAMAGGVRHLPPENGRNTRITALAALAMACGSLDDRAAAQQLYEALHPYAALWNVSGWGYVCNTAVTQVLGTLAGVMREWDIAIQHFEAAIQAHDREGAVTAQVHTLHNYARMLLTRNARGDRAQSRKLVTRGLTLATEHGLAHLGAKLAHLTARGRR
jgi:tetratricopeptide (TPR) repeat protein